MIPGQLVGDTTGDLLADLAILVLAGFAALFAVAAVGVGARRPLHAVAG